MEVGRAQPSLGSQCPGPPQPCKRDVIALEDLAPTVFPVVEVDEHRPDVVVGLGRVVADHVEEIVKVLPLLLRLQLQHLNHLLLHQNKNEKEELKEEKEKKSHQEGEEQEAGVEVGEEIQEEIQEMKENTEEVAADVGNVIEIIEEEVGTGTGKEETEENNKKEEEEVDQADQVVEVMKGGQLICVDNIEYLMIHTMAKRKYSDLR